MARTKGANVPTSTERRYRFRIIAPVIKKYGPNGRVHWRERSRYVKEVRTQAAWLVRGMVEPISITPPVRFRVTVGLLKRQINHPMDQLNLHGHLGIKAAIDGLADVLTNGDDAGWECIEIRTEPDPANMGYIEIEIQEAA